MGQKRPLWSVRPTIFGLCAPAFLQLSIGSIFRKWDLQISIGYLFSRALRLSRASCFLSLSLS